MFNDEIPQLSQNLRNFSGSHQYPTLHLDHCWERDYIDEYGAYGGLDHKTVQEGLHAAVQLLRAYNRHNCLPCQETIV